MAALFFKNPQLNCVKVATRLVASTVSQNLLIECAYRGQCCRQNYFTSIEATSYNSNLPSLKFAAGEISASGVFWSTSIGPSRVLSCETFLNTRQYECPQMINHLTSLDFNRPTLSQGVDCTCVGDYQKGCYFFINETMAAILNARWQNLLRSCSGAQ